MVAPAIAAPFESLTIPLTVPRLVCANAGARLVSTSSIASIRAVIASGVLLFICFCPPKIRCLVLSTALHGFDRWTGGAQRRALSALLLCLRFGCGNRLGEGARWQKPNGTNNGRSG